MSFQPPPGNPPPPPPEGWQPPGAPPGGFAAPPPPPPPPPPPYGAPVAGPPPAAGGPPPVWGPPPAPAKKSRKGLFIGLGVAAALVLLLIIVGVATVANRVSGGTSLADLRRGDCFNTSKALVAEKATRVDCTEPHSDEVAGILTLPGGGDSSYPGQEGILAFGKRDCLQQVQEFYGAKTPSATTQIFVFGPNKAAWSNGERTVVCSLREPTAAKRSGSYLEG